MNVTGRKKQQTKSHYIVLQIKSRVSLFRLFLGSLEDEIVIRMNNFGNKNPILCRVGSLCVKSWRMNESKEVGKPIITKVKRT